MNPYRFPAKVGVGRYSSAAVTASNMATKFQNVTRAPPQIVRQPPPQRAQIVDREELRTVSS